MMTNNLTLVQFFDLGIKEEGYWNYFHMVLQIEDVCDLLALKFPEYDFVILVDQLSGHGKKKEGRVKYNGDECDIWRQSKNAKHNNQQIGHLPCPIKYW